MVSVSLSRSFASVDVDALLGELRAPLPSKTVSRAQEAALAERLYQSIDHKGQSAKDRQRQREQEERRIQQGLFRPRISRRPVLHVDKLFGPRTLDFYHKRAARRIQREWRRYAYGSTRPGARMGSAVTAAVAVAPPSLCQLCERGDWAAVRQLLLASSDLGGVSAVELNRSGREGKRPLHRACMAARTVAEAAEAGELMLAADAELDGVDDDGITAIHLAAAAPSERLLKALYEAAVKRDLAADAAARDSGGAVSAPRGGRNARLLHKTDREGQTALHHAAATEAREAAAEAEAADPTMAEIHAAVVVEARRCRDLLVAIGLDPAIEDDYGRRADDLAPMVAGAKLPAVDTRLPGFDEARAPPAETVEGVQRQLRALAKAQAQLEEATQEHIGANMEQLTLLLGEVGRMQELQQSMRRKPCPAQPPLTPAQQAEQEMLETEIANAKRRRDTVRATTRRNEQVLAQLRADKETMQAELDEGLRERSAVMSAARGAEGALEKRVSEETARLEELLRQKRKLRKAVEELLTERRGFDARFNAAQLAVKREQARASRNRVQTAEAAQASQEAERLMRSRESALVAAHAQEKFELSERKAQLRAVTANIEEIEAIEGKAAGVSGDAGDLSGGLSGELGGTGAATTELGGGGAGGFSGEEALDGEGGVDVPSWTPAPSAVGPSHLDRIAAEVGGVESPADLLKQALQHREAKHTLQAQIRQGLDQLKRLQRAIQTAEQEQAARDTTTAKLEMDAKVASLEADAAERAVEFEEVTARHAKSAAKLAEARAAVRSIVGSASERRASASAPTPMQLSDCDAATTAELPLLLQAVREAVAARASSRGYAPRVAASGGSGDALAELRAASELRRAKAASSGKRPTSARPKKEEVNSLGYRTFASERGRPAGAGVA